MLKLTSLQHFYREVAKLPYKWTLRDGQIRRATEDVRSHCPRIALHEYHDGIRYEFKMGEVYKAADNTSGYDPEIRKALLKACNLKERTA